MSRVIDLTAIEESPPSLPRPTIAAYPIEPRRRLRDGSSSSHSRSTRSASESVGMISFTGGGGGGGGGGRRLPDLVRSGGPNNRRGRERSRGVHPEGPTGGLGLGISNIKDERGIQIDDDDIHTPVYVEGDPEGPSATSASASMTTIPDTSPSPPPPSTQSRKRKHTTTTSRSRSTEHHRRPPPQPIPISSDSDSSLFEVVDRPPTSKLDKGKGKAREITPEPEENLLAFFQCPICLAPPMQAVLTPCGHIMCGACLFSTLKSQAIRDGRKPLPPGTYPTQLLSGRKIRQAVGRKRLEGRILQGNCPVCRNEIEGGMSTVPGEGGVKYLEVKTITEV